MQSVELRVMRIFAFLLFLVPFFGFSQKSDAYQGFYLEYSDSIFYLVDSSENRDSLGTFLKIDIQKFKKAVDSCDVPDGELIKRIAEMYHEPRGCPSPSKPKTMASVSKVVFINACMSQFFIKELITTKQ